MYSQNASTPRPSTPPNAYTLTLHLSPWSFPRLFLSDSSPESTHPHHPPSATSTGASGSRHTAAYTTTRAPPQYQHDSESLYSHSSETDSETDEEEADGEEEWSHHAHSDAEPSLLYARDSTPRMSHHDEPSLLYTVRRRGGSPPRFTIPSRWDDSDLLQLGTPATRRLGSVVEINDGETPRPRSVYSSESAAWDGGEGVEEYHLELPTARCLWEWRWAVAAAAGFLVAWGAAACGRYGVSGVAAAVVWVAVRCM